VTINQYGDRMAEPQPHISFDATPRQPSAAVLVLHGGREASLDPVSATQLAVLRMIPISRRIARAAQGRLAVARLRYAVRGWNGPLRSPVADTQWAIDRLTERYPGLPIGLVGHSMGGRSALRAGGHPSVSSVVGLASWLPAGEPIEQLAGRQVLLVHGSADRITSAKGSVALAARLREARIAAGLVEIEGERHAMLRRPGLWHDLAAGFMLATLLDQSDELPAPHLLRRVIEGEPRITA
jgi:alpha-beta hydrolase superfamily lysophospholipase